MYIDSVDDTILSCLSLACEAVYEEDVEIFFKTRFPNNDGPFFGYRASCFGDEAASGRFIELDLKTEDQSEAVVVAFRGTDSFSDWMINCQAWPSLTSAGLEHAGFGKRANFYPYCELLHRLQNGVKVFMTGHSLGGAVAIITASRLIRMMESSFSVSELIPRLQVVTFGCPLVGDETFATTMSRHFKTFINIIHVDDMVPRIASIVSNALECLNDGLLKTSNAIAKRISETFKNFFLECLLPVSVSRSVESLERLINGDLCSDLTKFAWECFKSLCKYKAFGVYFAISNSNDPTLLGDDSIMKFLQDVGPPSSAADLISTLKKAYVFHMMHSYSGILSRAQRKRFIARPLILAYRVPSISEVKVTNLPHKKHRIVRITGNWLGSIRELWISQIDVVHQSLMLWNGSCQTVISLILPWKDIASPVSVTVKFYSVWNGSVQSISGVPLVAETSDFSPAIHKASPVDLITCAVMRCFFAMNTSSIAANADLLGVLDELLAATPIELLFQLIVDSNPMSNLLLERMKCFEPPSKWLYSDCGLKLIDDYIERIDDVDKQMSSAASLMNQSAYESEPTIEPSSDDTTDEAIPEMSFDLSEEEIASIELEVVDRYRHTAESLRDLQIFIETGSARSLLSRSIVTFALPAMIALIFLEATVSSSSIAITTTVVAGAALSGSANRIFREYFTTTTAAKTRARDYLAAVKNTRDELNKKVSSFSTWHIPQFSEVTFSAEVIPLVSTFEHIYLPKSEVWDKSSRFLSMKHLMYRAHKVLVETEKKKEKDWKEQFSTAKNGIQELLSICFLPLAQIFGTAIDNSVPNTFSKVSGVRRHQARNWSSLPSRAVNWMYLIGYGVVAYIKTIMIGAYNWNLTNAMNDYRRTLANMYFDIGTDAEVIAEKEMEYITLLKRLCSDLRLPTESKTTFLLEQDIKFLMDSRKVSYLTQISDIISNWDGVFTADSSIDDRFKFQIACRLKIILCCHELREVMKLLPVVGLFGTSNAGKTFVTHCLLRTSAESNMEEEEDEEDDYDEENVTETLAPSSSSSFVDGVPVPGIGDESRTFLPGLYTHPTFPNLQVLDTMGLDDGALQNETHIVGYLDRLRKMTDIQIYLFKYLDLQSMSEGNNSSSVSQLYRQTVVPPNGESQAPNLTAITWIESFVLSKKVPKKKLGAARVASALDEDEKRRKDSYSYPAIRSNDARYPRWWLSLSPEMLPRAVLDDGKIKQGKHVRDWVDSQVKALKGI